MKNVEDLIDALRRGVMLHEECGRRYAEAAVELAARGWAEQAALMRRAASDAISEVAMLGSELAELSALHG